MQLQRDRRPLLAQGDTLFSAAVLAEPGVVVAEVMRVRLHRAEVDEVERVCLYIVQKIRPAHKKQ